VNRVERIHELRSAALGAINRCAWKKALTCYKELEQLETSEGDWPRKAGEMCRKLHLVEEANAELTRALGLYTRAGTWLKAIAVCKLILAIDPLDVRAKRKLEVLWFCQQARIASTMPQRAHPPAHGQSHLALPGGGDLATPNDGE
jgi:hypothetical protein